MLHLAAVLLAASPFLADATVLGGDSDEIDRRLADLSAQKVQVRHDAERWLSANVEAADISRLARLLTAGDAEVRLRVSRIISQADADLTMTAALLGAREAQLVEVGAEILAERINRWNPRMAARGETDMGVGQILSELAQDHGPRALQVSLDQPLQEVCALLERRGALPIGIAVEAEVRDARLRRPDQAEVVASWSELVPRLGMAYSVGLDLFGFERTDTGELRRGFLRFTPLTVAGRDPGLETGEEVLLRWFRLSTSATQESRRIAAVCNLAASGWPDALAWLEARYRDQRDPVALEGLLVAAVTGRVVSVLFEADVVRRLVREAGADLDASTPARVARGHRIVDALSQLGCLGRRGEDLASVVLEGWDTSGPRARWARLAILEGLRCPTAAAALDAALLDPALLPVLRIQALRAWTAASSTRAESPPSRSLPGAEALIESVQTAAQAAELGRQLAGAGFQPPAAWADPGQLPGAYGFAPRVAVFGWLLSAGSPEQAARLGLDLLERAPGEDAQARGAALAAVFSTWVERGTWVRLAETWSAARAAAADDRARLEVDRVAALARLVPPEDGMQVFEALRDRPLPSGPDLALLGVAAGWGQSSTAEFARQRLTVLLQEALAEDRPLEAAGELLAAIETALGELQRLGMDAVALDWRRPTILSLIQRYRKEADLARQLSGDWPPYPVLQAVDPARKDRRLPPETP